jgi:hypothetical protein
MDSHGRTWTDTEAGGRAKLERDFADKLMSTGKRTGAGSRVRPRACEAKALSDPPSLRRKERPEGAAFICRGEKAGKNERKDRK